MSLSPAKLNDMSLDMKESYSSCILKLEEAGRKFNRAKDSAWLKAFEHTHIEYPIFREQLKLAFNIKLSERELESVSIHFDNDGYVNGAKFLLLFYRIRSELRKEMQATKIANDKRAKEAEKASKIMEIAATNDHSDVVPDFNFSKRDHKIAMSKLTEAAVKYDKNMPGSVALTGFDGASLNPGEFKDQLKRCFGITTNDKELGAILHHFDKNDDGFISCQEFLVSFFRLGFEERNRRRIQEREMKQAHLDHLANEKKMIEEEKERRAALKVNHEFSARDQERGMKKLRRAAKMFDRTAPGAPSLAAFDTSDMPAHIFNEQLKKIFKLKLTPHELGGVMAVFDLDGNGEVSCSEFTKTFLHMGFEERSREMREHRAKQKKAEEDRLKAKADELLALENKNAATVDYEYDDEEFASALGKLTEAAYKYDRNQSGAPNLSAFDMKEMAPHIFKEQLFRAFGIKVNPKELGALMNIFDTEESGSVTCSEFLIKFIKVGMEERMRRKAEWRKHEADVAAKRRQEQMEKQLAADMKGNLKVDYDFNEAEYNSAYNKLKDAAIKYEKGAPGASGLNAFDGESMAPHIFREQLKLVFNMKISPPELGALMLIFDKDGDGVVNCQEFLMKFFKIGTEERTRINSERIEQKKAYKKRKEEEKLQKELEEKQIMMGEADFDFVEEDFDKALKKLLYTCMTADKRTLGPAGLKIFEAATLTPKEFREALRRTFALKVTAAELGALTTFFDTSISGVVNTHSFISVLVVERARLAPYKGKEEEEDRLMEEFKVLKEEYIRRMKRAVEGVNANERRPWEETAPNRSIQKGMKSIPGLAPNRGYPKSILQKLSRRLKIGKATGRLDLSAKFSWDNDQAKKREINMQLQIDKIMEEREKKRKEEPDKYIPPSEIEKQKLADHLRSCIFSYSTDPVGVIEWSHVHDQLHAHDVHQIEEITDRKCLEFRLHLWPDEIFHIPGLRELWLDNHLLKHIPAEIGLLKQLRLISMRCNMLESLPPEICMLSHLKQLIFHGNKLKKLPELFGNLKKLIELDISNNQFIEFPEQLTKIVSLNEVDLSMNKITTLPISLKKMRGLTALSLTDNQFGDETPDVLSQLPWVRVSIDGGFNFEENVRSAMPLIISIAEEKEFEKAFKHKAMMIRERKKREEIENAALTKKNNPLLHKGM